MAPLPIGDDVLHAQAREKDEYLAETLDELTELVNAARTHQQNYRWTEMAICLELLCNRVDRRAMPTCQWLKNHGRLGLVRSDGGKPAREGVADSNSFQLGSAGRQEDDGSVIRVDLCEEDEEVASVSTNLSEEKLRETRATVCGAELREQCDSSQPQPQLRREGSFLMWEGSVWSRRRPGGQQFRWE